MTNSRQASRHRQRGTFIIECVAVMSALALIISFTIDMVSAQNMHGRLQRLAYSGATLMRERDALYEGRKELNGDDVYNLFRVLGQSLSRTHREYVPDRLGLHVEQIVYHASSGDTSSVSYQQGMPCQPSQRARENHHLFSDGEDLTVYQVTLCHSADSFFQRLLGRSGVIRASMLMPER